MSKCPQCDSLYINGVFCHETGCPNKKWRPTTKKKPATPKGKKP